MENFSTSFATTSPFMPNLNTDESVNFPSTSSARYLDNPAEYRPSNESLQLPNTYTWNHAGQSSYVYPPTYPLFQAQTGVEFRLPNSNPMASHGVQGLCPSQEREIDLHAQMTKIARSNRKMARQRSLSLSKNSSDVPAATTRCTTRRPALSSAFNDVQNTSTTTDEDLYTFCTPDNKKLRVLLKKVLRNSDVGSLGRIVLPKIEAEKNLPILSVKEGIPVIIRDAYSNREWRLRYKFWLNNKSKMYVLENTGDFVRQNGLQIGDSITLYEDESKNLYFSIQKMEKPAAGPSYNQHYSTHNYNHLYASFGNQARDEDAASLAILIEQLKHKEQHEANSLVTFSMDGAASFRQWEVEAQYGSSNNVTSEENSSQQVVAAAEMRNFDDCYCSLGTLPDVNHYNYPYFDFMSSDSHDVQGDEQTYLCKIKP